MKKYLLVLAFLILPATTFAANTATPNTYSASTDTIAVHADSGVTAVAFQTAADGGNNSGSRVTGTHTVAVIQDGTGNPVFGLWVTPQGLFEDWYTAFTDGHDFHILFFTTAHPDTNDVCLTDTTQYTSTDFGAYATMYDYCAANALTNITVTHSSGGGGDPAPTGVAALIATASTTFIADLGFNWSNVIALMKSQMLIVMGTGLGVLRLMLPYVIALIIIGAIVYFIYRAFRFFKH